MRHEFSVFDDDGASGLGAETFGIFTVRSIVFGGWSDYDGMLSAVLAEKKADAFDGFSGGISDPVWKCIS